MILPCFLARLYLDQILSGTLEELCVNLGKIPANKNLARQSWLFIQDTCKILGNIFSRVVLLNWNESDNGDLTRILPRLS